MKEYYNKFKEFRKDPKKRSISLIILYGIFFLFVIIYIRGNNSVNNIEQKEEVNNTENVTNYEYSYEINVDDDIINVDGIFLDNKELFEIDNIKYFIQDNKIFLNNQNEEVSLNYPLIHLNYNSLKKFINSFVYESKTEYKDSNTKYEYNINNNEVAKFFEEDNNNDGLTNIIVYESEFINKIEINLSNYYNKNKYIITVNYNNINNISNIQINELG